MTTQRRIELAQLVRETSARVRNTQDDILRIQHRIANGKMREGDREQLKTLASMLEAHDRLLCEASAELAAE